MSNAHNSPTFLALYLGNGRSDYSRLRCLTSTPRKDAKYAREVLGLMNVTVKRFGDAWSVVGKLPTAVGGAA
jgi:hypothetical protein